jgi:DNA-binding transcriptional regulator LsrR (DeoR family)
MKTEKILMAQVATLYYHKNLTQQEIAETLGLTRQTVSKLLNDAINEKLWKS